MSSGQDHTESRLRQFRIGQPPEHGAHERTHRAPDETRGGERCHQPQDRQHGRAAGVSGRTYLLVGAAREHGAAQEERFGGRAQQ
ncbi:MAG: hypothetical protein IPJ04_17925, partial [Candidatus Eisenbacteria bacterium]|nr:hypothetical protein [Candidatus Eisenbacteria bacterium]